MGIIQCFTICYRRAISSMQSTLWLFHVAEWHLNDGIFTCDCSWSNPISESAYSGIPWAVHILAPTSTTNSLISLSCPHLQPHQQVAIAIINYYVHTCHNNFEHGDPNIFVLIVIMIWLHCTYNGYGPLVHLWSMRFEGKHKQFKSAARCSSLRNILKTLSQHHQRLLAYNLQCNSGYASVTVSTGASIYNQLLFIPAWIPIVYLIIYSH